MTKEKIDIMDKILDYKSELCDKCDIQLGVRCMLTDLIFAAYNAGKIEALKDLNIQFHLDFDQKSLDTKMERIEKYFEQRINNETPIQ